MAGTAELDRLLEELKLTSMNMASGLPPYSGKPSTSVVHSSSYTPGSQKLGYSGGRSPPLRHQSYTSESRYRSSTMTSSNRASSAMGLYGGASPEAGRSASVSGNFFASQPTSHPQNIYQKQANDRRMNSTAMYSAYPSYLRSDYSPVPAPRHQSTYTTVLKTRPPVAPPKQYSQVHLTIDPEYGMAEAISGASTSVQTPPQPPPPQQQYQFRESGRREQRLESELAAVREELAHYRRAMSLVQERQRYSSHSELQHSSSITDHQHHYHQQQQQQQPPPLACSSKTIPKTTSFLTQLQERNQQQKLQQQKQQQQQNGYSFQSSSQVRQQSLPTYQRYYQRAENQHSSLLSSGQPRRTMSHINVYNPRSWSLRANQASESDLASRRVATVSNALPRSTYSAHRERLRQEKEQEMWRRQHMMTASSTGLNDPQQQFKQKSRGQQQYQSLTAVDQTGGTEAFQEIETIILQPIGRGIHDIDSRVGSMTTLSRGPGGSMSEGLHRTEDGLQYQRNNLQRNYASTQFLNRNNSNLDINRSGTGQNLTMMQMQGTGTPQHLHQNNSFQQQQQQQQQVTTGGTLMNSNHYGSRSQISVADSATLVAAAPPQQSAPAPPPIQSQPTSPSPWLQSSSHKGASTGAGGDQIDSGIDFTGIQGPTPSWYRPTLTRAEAISILRDKPPGSFLVRHSSTYAGIFVLAVKLSALPPKVSQKTRVPKFIKSILQDLQSELVRHYLIDVVTYPTRGVRIKGFASEPVFPTLAALIHQHTVNSLALPCRLILPPSSTPSTPANGPQFISVQNGATVMAAPPAPSNRINIEEARPSLVEGVTGRHQYRSDTGRNGIVGVADDPFSFEGMPIASNTIPFVCVVRDSPPMPRSSTSSLATSELELSGKTFRCFMLGSIDTPQWDDDICLARSVDKLIPRDRLTASECDHGVSPVLYTEVQLHVSAHDGITIIDLQKRSFLRRHLSNQVLKYCGLETRGKEFLHPTHQLKGIDHPRIFGIVVRKGISECTTHVFSECDPQNSAENIVRHILSTYPHLSIR